MIMAVTPYACIAAAWTLLRAIGLWIRLKLLNVLFNRVNFWQYNCHGSVSFVLIALSQITIPKGNRPVLFRLRLCTELNQGRAGQLSGNSVG